MAEMRHDNTNSTHCRDVGTLSLEPSYQQGMQRCYETYCNGLYLAILSIELHVL